MLVWQRTPFLKIFVAVAAGILLADAFPMLFSSPAWYVALGCALTLLFAVKWKYTFRFVFGAAFCSVWLLCGAWMATMHQPQHQALHYMHSIAPRDTCILLCTARSVPKQKEWGISLQVECNAVVRQSGDTLVCSGTLPLFIAQQTAPHGVLPGDKIAARVQCSSMAPPLNPGAFDYQRYAMRKGMTHQARSVGNVAAMSAGTHWRGVRAQCLVWREELLARMQTHVHDTAVFHLLAALVLGKTDDMEDELLAAYSRAGVVHILAVSGLHVGLIYALIAPLSKRIFSKRKGKWVKTIVPVALLWTFAGITGFSPSVLRAAVMFSFFIVTENFQRKGTPLNTLFASAVVLLAFDPFMLFDVGFQLSYLAVLGIVLLQKPLVRLLSFRNKWLAAAWQMMAVSLAAQCTTLPITVACFHQFPLYFLLTNAVAIPLSTALLYVALALLACASWSVPATLLANVCETLTRIMNAAVSYLGQLPGSLWDEIYLHTYEVFLLCACVAFVTFAIYTASWKWTKAALAVVCVWSCAALMEAVMAPPAKTVCVHSTRAGVAVSFVQGEHLTLMADSTFLSSEKNRRYIIEPLKAHYHLHAADTIVLRPHASWQMAGKQWTYELASASAAPAADVLLLGAPERGKRCRIDTTNSVVSCIVSVGRWSERQWQKIPWDKLAKQVHHTEQGAFLLSP